MPLFLACFLTIISVGMLGCESEQQPSTSRGLTLSLNPSSEAVMHDFVGTELDTQLPCHLRVLGVQGEFSQRGNFKARVQASFMAGSSSHENHFHDSSLGDSLGGEEYFPVAELSFHPKVSNLLHSTTQVESGSFKLGVGLAASAMRIDQLSKDGYSVGYSEFCSHHGHTIYRMRYCQNLQVTQIPSEEAGSNDAAGTTPDDSTSEAPEVEVPSAVPVRPAPIVGDGWARRRPRHCSGGCQH